MESWTEGPGPWTVRAQEIRQRLDGYAGHQLRPEGVAAMLRDAMARCEQLAGALAVRRAETLCEAAELLRRVDHPAAAELLDSQVMLDTITAASGGRLPHSTLVRIWSGLADVLAAEPAWKLGEGFVTDFLGEQLADRAGGALVAPE